MQWPMSAALPACTSEVRDVLLDGDDDSQPLVAAALSHSHLGIVAVSALCTAGLLGLAALSSLPPGSSKNAEPRSLGTGGITDAWKLPPNFDGSLFGQHYVLEKRYDLSQPPEDNFEVQQFSDEGLTNSCANYVDDGSTVFTRKGNLVLRVAGACPDGKCLNSGRVMSKQAFKYGIFTWSIKLPKCHGLWPAIWLLPGHKNGLGAYGQWPCSGEIDVMETIDSLNSSGFNIVTGYGGSKMGCWADDKNVSAICDRCSKKYCMSTTLGKPHIGSNSYFVEDVNCSSHADAHPSWSEHTFVFSWQPGSMITWVDPDLSYNKAGELVSVVPKRKAAAGGYPSWKAYEYKSTPTWLAAEEYMGKCYPGSAAWGAPFDKPMRLMLNLAIGGYGQAPCVWGNASCTDAKACGKAVGAEMIVSDISIWQKAGAGPLDHCFWALAAACLHAASIVTRFEWD